MAADSIASGQLEVKDKSEVDHSVSVAENGDLGGEMTPEEEARMVRKMDINIFPVVVVLYILSFLDRVNIGQFCASIFFPPRASI